jgi:hypothetical protein
MTDRVSIQCIIKTLEGFQKKYRYKYSIGLDFGREEVFIRLDTSIRPFVDQSIFFPFKDLLYDESEFIDYKILDGIQKLQQKFEEYK